MGKSRTQERFISNRFDKLKAQITPVNLMVTILIVMLFFIMVPNLIDPMIVTAKTQMEAAPTPYTSIIVMMMQLLPFFMLIMIIIGMITLAQQRQQNY